MDIPSYYISSSIVNVDTEITKKVVFLPPASTVVGKTFWVHDLKGTTFFSTICISTIGVDTIDYTYGSNGIYAFLEMSGRYDSYRFIAQSTTNYSIIGRALNNFWPPP